MDKRGCNDVRKEGVLSQGKQEAPPEVRKGEEMDSPLLAPSPADALTLPQRK